MMKKLIIIPLTICLLPALFYLSSCEEDPTDAVTVQHAFPLRSIDCNEDSDVFENQNEKDVTVKIEVTDYCEGGSDDEASQVQKIDDGGFEVKSVELEDRKTKVICWTVKPGESIRLKCRGADGGCSYTLVVIQ